MYSRVESLFLEDSRARFADFGSRSLALHDGFVQNEAALKERVTRFMDASNEPLVGAPSNVCIGSCLLPIYVYMSTSFTEFCIVGVCITDF